ncbi:LOW QUALITY PROTEIN: hypothetical protein BC938DRAFT_477741 [Jimgerdemannia flammicorona]|uniref:Zn-dependent exopeptidase n=1 Tax=Jimgerdemannia flammicorona TaxID=994334 RepID=A0A433QNY9_9FUNG|nr:LOW QUALITY PROTEIN: hypothetical protein BC938DRAFT_477741 [Jimgerdemannia flammicorona]
MSSKSDYAPLPTADPDGESTTAEPVYKGYFDEYGQPVIDRRRMTIEPPSTSWARVAMGTLLSLLTMALMASLLAIWIDGEERPHGGYKLFIKVENQRKLTALTFFPPNLSIAGPTNSEAEHILLTAPSCSSLRDTLEHYTSVAHLAGTEADRLQAEWTRDRFIEAGLTDTQIVEYWPLLNYPKYRRVAIVEPEELRFEAKLREDIAEDDETSKEQDATPTFHGYSASGNVTAPLVYVNYGHLSDFEHLTSLGVNLTGTIALVRYGGVFRGLKVRAAERFGCLGVLIYSDPADDGPLNKPGNHDRNHSYPSGPWRSPSSVQRGSVQFLSVAPGDPLTPGWAATKDANRIPVEEATNLPSIPSLPISWEDAEPLLRALGGQGVSAPEGWSGGLEVGYFTGPSLALVNLVNDVESEVKPIWNVVAKIEGREEPDRVVILGNHRDAWVFGAVDPSSGSTALVEVAHSLGALLKKDWRPRRTIILASWDAEEYGLVGSTEWVEDNASWLREQAVTYINVDTAVSGRHFVVEASPSLALLLFNVTRLVEDPHTGQSVYDAWRATPPEGPHRVNAAMEYGGKNDEPNVGQLGAGSDYVPFLDFVGVSSLSMAFRGEYGVYHSNYDSFHWMEKFGDPDFSYHKAITQIWSLIAFRLSNDPILPFSPTRYASDLSTFVDDLVHSAPPNNGTPHQALELQQLRKAIADLHDSSLDLENDMEKIRKRLPKRERNGKNGKHGRHNSAKLERRLRKLNDRLAKFERGFIDPLGLEGRPWYKHVVFAPGLWAGYKAQTFPGIAEKIAEENWDEVADVERRVAGFVREAGRWMDGGC